MMGRKGASLATTRKIHRREVKKHREAEARLAAYRAAGRPEADICVVLVRDIVESGRRQLSGEPAFAPVGVLSTLWRQVCEESNRNSGRLSPGRAYCNQRVSNSSPDTTQRSPTMLLLLGILAIGGGLGLIYLHGFGLGWLLGAGEMIGQGLSAVLEAFDN